MISLLLDSSNIKLGVAIAIDDNENINDYVSSFIKEAMIQGSIEGIKQIGELIATFL